MPAAASSSPIAASSPSIASPPPPPARILAEARALFFSHGYSAFTMDDLATSLGMSKKTLYVYYSGKDAMIRAVIDSFAAEVRADTETLLGNHSLRFAEKLRGFAQAMTERLSKLTPHILGDLEQYAPALHRYVLDTRAKNLPYVFGLFIEEGQLCGAVRDDVSPVFARFSVKGGAEGERDGILHSQGRIQDQPGTEHHTGSDSDSGGDAGFQID